MATTLINDIKRRMDTAIEALQKDFSGLRTGRASINLLDPIKVDAYGSLMPLAQTASVSAPEARLLVVSVWDKGLVKNVEKAVRESDLGLNPMTEGQTIRIHLPELNQERRNELSKIATKYAENGRVAVRNVRRDGMEALKKMEKDKQISEDEHRKYSDDVQKITDDHIKKIDELLATKDKEIKTI
jgi:ribosome recycling factor